MLGKDLLAVTGSLSSHPDGERISHFVHNRGVRLLKLTDGLLVDGGSILSLMEADGKPRRGLTFEKWYGILLMKLISLNKNLAQSGAPKGSARAAGSAFAALAWTM